MLQTQENTIRCHFLFDKTFEKLRTNFDRVLIFTNPMSDLICYFWGQVLADDNQIAIIRCQNGRACSPSTPQMEGRDVFPNLYHRSTRASGRPERKRQQSGAIEGEAGTRKSFSNHRGPHGFANGRDALRLGKRSHNETASLAKTPGTRTANEKFACSFKAHYGTRRTLVPSNKDPCDRGQANDSHHYV
jgi:hypothetical protein